LNKTAIISLTCAAVLLAACHYTPSAEDQDTQQTQALQAQAAKEVGMPNITHFTEKRLATELAELRDQPDLSTYTYMQGIDGKLICLGRSIGFGIPYSTQITNPQRADYYSAGPVALPQAEPNGLYMPESASATWVMLVGKDGKAHPTYVEPNITVTTVALSGPAVSAPCS